jgi:5-methylcytosine-specific restriction endonuclease McrA
MDWFKFYHNKWLTDPIIMNMPARDRMCFITILCLASQEDEDRDGTIRNYSEETVIKLSNLDIDFENPKDSDYFKAFGVTDRLEDVGLIKRINDKNIKVTNFAKRQETNLSNAERQKRYREKHPEKVKRYSFEKRLRDADIDPQDWYDTLEEQDFKCAHCGKSHEQEPLTLDHIQPISKGGTGHKRNIQALCRPCNTRKKDKNNEEITELLQDSNAKVTLDKIREDKNREDNSNTSSKKTKKKKPVKHKYGEYKNVLLTDDEKQKLKDKFGTAKAKALVKELDEGIELKGYKYKSHYLAILKWSKNTKPTGSFEPNNNATDIVKRDQKRREAEADAKERAENVQHNERQRALVAQMNQLTASKSVK